MSVHNVRKMSLEIKNQACSKEPSKRGPLSFQGIWTLLGYIFESGKNQRFGLANQAGSIPDIHTNPLLPTGQAQGCDGPALNFMMQPSVSTRCTMGVLHFRGRDG
jgi:hypothetical protein